MTAPDVQAFHIAVVVNDLDAAIERYRRLLNAQTWQTRQMGPRTRIAYGSGSGQTWELIEVKGEGTSQFHQFRDRHGEGVQHIGFWTPDLRASIEGALDEGGRVVSATRDASGVMAVQLLPRADVPASYYDGLGIGAFIEGGLGGWRIEYIGPAGETFLKDWLADSYDEIIVTPKP